MKRYRILGWDFDTRVHSLKDADESWEESVKRLHIQNKENVLAGLKSQYGEDQFEMKLKNFKDLDVLPFSVVAYHNKFLRQSRNAFMVGSYYPALTGVCALGERVLNHLILKLRDYFKHTPEYQKVYNKDSFDRWDRAIDVLSKWDVLLPEVATAYLSLGQLRNRSIHFNPITDTNDRELALEAITLFQEIVNKQFSAFGKLPWFITSIPGEVYIKKSWEGKPFIKEVYLSNCVQLGPKHKIVSVIPLKIEDFFYEERDIDDEEYSRLRLSSR